MTDFSKTITNSIRAFGIGPTTKWDSPMTWGTTKWGEGSVSVQTIKYINVGINNAVTPNSDVIRYAQHLITNAIGSTSTPHRYVYKGISNSQDSTSELLERQTVKVVDNYQPSTSEMSKDVTMGFTSTMVCTADLADVRIYDSAGYCDNFPGSKQNAKDRIWDRWTSLTAGTDGFTETTDAATAWSEQ